MDTPEIKPLSAFDLKHRDKVVCIDTTSGLFTAGKVYGITVLDGWPHITCDSGFIYQTSTLNFSDFAMAADDAPVKKINPKTAFGLAKPPLSVVPPSAMFVMGQAMVDGKAKYGAMNWRESAVPASIYYDAALRHLMAWWDGEDKAEDSKVDHLGHVMACMAILVDAKHSGTLDDDRPVKGELPAVLKQLVRPLD
jgi:hypothetical protein